MSKRPRLKTILATLADDLVRPGRIASSTALARRIQRTLEPLRPADCPAYGNDSAASGGGEYLTHLAWAVERSDESRYAGLALSVEGSTTPTPDGLLTALHPLLDVWARRRVLVATVPRGTLDDSNATASRIETVYQHLRRHQGSGDDAKVGVLLRETAGGRAACWIVRIDGSIKQVTDRSAAPTTRVPAQGQLFGSAATSRRVRDD